MEKHFDENAYKNQYMKEHYTSCKVLLKPEEAELLAKYSEETGIAKSVLLKRCLLFCYENMVDVSELPEIPPKK